MECEGELVKRKDDNLESLEQRLHVYRAKTAPLVEEYRKRGILKVIDASKDIEQIYSEIESYL